MKQVRSSQKSLSKKKNKNLNLPPQARVSERNPLDFMPNITHRNKKLFSI